MRNSPEWLKELCDAFADGINYYLHTHPEVRTTIIDSIRTLDAYVF